MLDTQLGSVLVATMDGRGATPEELAERALDKIMYIGAEAPPAIRDQAEAFRDGIRRVLVYYMHDAIRAHNVTVANRLTQAGHPELVPVLSA